MSTRKPRKAARKAARRAPRKGTLVITIVDCTPREGRALLADAADMLQSNKFLGGSITVRKRGEFLKKVDVTFTPAPAAKRRVTLRQVRPALLPFKMTPGGLER